MYLLPNGTGGWTLTAPAVANARYTGREKELGDQLTSIVRLLKAWNRAHSKRMQSFHLETVTATTFKTVGKNHRTSLQRFFEWAPTRLTVSDPGGQSGDLSSYLTTNERQALREALNASADRAKRANVAELRGDHVEAKRLWRIILGDEFPTQ